MNTEKVLEVLRQVEWAGAVPWRNVAVAVYPPGGPGQCPWCGGWESEGHRDNCKLVALLDTGVLIMDVCQDCKHWAPVSWDNVLEGWGSCHLTASDGGICIGDRGAGPYHKESRAFGWGGADYDNILVTAPDFGCVQFEQQDQDDSKDQSPQIELQIERKSK